MRTFSLIGLLALAGCGPSDSRVAVAGTVMNGAAPLASGIVRFTPDAGVPVAAGITAGKYSAQVPPGKYRVTIEANSGAMIGNGMAPSSEERLKGPKLTPIPEKYRLGIPTDIAGPNPALDFDLAK